VKKIAAKYFKPLAQVVMKCHLQRGLVVVPKSVNPSRISQNIGDFYFELRDEGKKKSLH